jgi:hypothetical protein
MCTMGLVLASCGEKQPAPGTVLDEARRAERMESSFPAADENYFKDMDGGLELTTNEVKGRNNWIVWTGGNDRFWDHLVNRSYGAVDFLKILRRIRILNTGPRHSLKNSPGQRTSLLKARTAR